MFGHSGTVLQEHSVATRHSQSGDMPPEHLSLHKHTCNSHGQSHTLAGSQTYKDAYSVKSHAAAQPTGGPHRHTLPDLTRPPLSHCLSRH